MADAEPDRPPVKALFVQLAEDSAHFARSEWAYLREQAGERWHFAQPALVAVGAAIALLFAVAVALPLGLMVALAPVIGPFWAVLAVTLAGLILGGVLLRWASKRLKAAMKKPEER